ncbi:MAG: type 4a pilus biogenesis protein PilO [Myxococcales bacterium]|nr:type 4a pilus biogenesis protein PilO [Myxococcales bacterium]MDH5305806.1 type 4a pilus biogenesis protein PilO [Myxococcales bacterium]MDH5566805.1 type 4a pilus biogenesis protein PilO [Myxococcales bacterium]
MLGTAALVCALYYFLVYEHLATQRENLHLEETKLQRRLSEVRSIAANIAAFESEIADLEVKLNAALRQLPNEKQLEVLLTDITNLGKTAGVEISSFRRQDEVLHDFYAEVPISIELSGAYHDIARFFDLMSKLPRIVNMGSLKMEVSRESLEGTWLKVSGTATTFRFVGKS